MLFTKCPDTVPQKQQIKYDSTQPNGQIDTAVFICPLGNGQWAYKTSSHNIDSTALKQNSNSQSKQLN
jgi:hypothetical protein